MNNIKRGRLEELKVIKLRLRSLELVEFVYEGFSEYIEALEPETNSILEIFDYRITLEILEEGIKEYKKFVKFKGYINKIKSEHVLWLNRMEKYKIGIYCLTYEDFRKVSDFNLENPLISLLALSINNYEKDFIEKLNNPTIDGIELPNNESGDNLLLYYLQTENINDLFTLACYNGHLETAKFLIKIDAVINVERALSVSCKINQFEIVKWIYKLDLINDEQRSSGLYSALKYKHLKIARWLLLENKELLIYKPLEKKILITELSKNGILETIELIDEFDKEIDYNHYFPIACKNNKNLELIKWIANKGLTIETIKTGFMISCLSNNLEIGKWLINYNFSKNFKEEVYQQCINYNLLEMTKWLSTLEINNLKNLNENFQMACRKGLLEMAQWLYTLDIEKIDLKEIKKYIKYWIKNDHLEMAKWLFSIKKNELEKEEVLILLKNVCESGNIKIVEWLFSIYKFDVSEIDLLNIETENKIIRDWLMELKL